MGTPKRLSEAVLNGFKSCDLSKEDEEVASQIEAHVRDFLNQKLGAMMLSQDQNEVRMAEKMHFLLIG